jgi:hypothetical protein
LGPLFAWRDAAADHAGAGEAGKEAAGAGREAADAEKEAGAKAEEPDEEEEATPSPWSIPLTLVGDLSDLDEEDGGQLAEAEDHGTGKSPAAGEKPVPERTGSDVWTRPSWASTEEKRAGSAQADGGSGPEKPDEAERAGAGADRGPWLTRPGKDTTAGWDSGDAAATRTGAKADDAKADAGDDATPGKTARWAGALPLRAGRDDPSAGAGRDDAITGAGRDDAATRAGRDDADVRPGRDHAGVRTGGDGSADDHAKATPAGRAADADGEPAASRAGRDDAAARAGRDDADVRAGRDSGTDDQAKATGTGRRDGDAASRTRADTDADAAADTSAASAGSGPAPGEEAGPRTDGEAKPSPATPVGKATPVSRPSATPVSRPSATLFEPASRATPGGSPDPVTAKTAGPGTQREAPSGTEGAADQRAPEAGSGTGAGQTGPAAARDDDARGAAERGGAGKSGPAPATDGSAVVIVPGVARYHRTGCILIRFLGGDDLETLTAQEAKAKGCAPCRACEPDKPLSSGD